CKITQKGVEYNGTLNKTLSGRTCQRWDSQTPHAHSSPEYGFPNGFTSHSFCRNPGNDPNGPWC
ncbi:hypothetical protein CAPTEDRAFT_51065, partial [Capitella teleta]